MKYDSIADIYAANRNIRTAFRSVVEGLTADEATLLPDGERWSIQQIVEHVSIVDSGMLRICVKLLTAAKASGKPADAKVPLSTDFGAKSREIAGRKVEAPERVHPTGDVPIADAIGQMTGNIHAFEALRDDLESCDVAEPTFPHPFFGDLNAVEWLVLKGGHESRHTNQITVILSKIRGDSRS